MIIGMPPKEQTNRNTWSCHAFIRLQAGASPEVVTAKMISQLRERYAKGGMSPEDVELELKKSEPRLNNLKDLYFHSGNVEYAARSGNQATTYTLLGVAILIDFIACINFFNFFLALVPSRIRAVNTRKVFGGSNLRLRMGFFAETIGLVILALLIGAVLVMLFANTSLASYLTTAVFSPNNLDIALLLIISALILGIVISIYPAHYITSFPPALATKGNFQSTRSGILLRYILIGIQFVISTVLIIVALFINLQHSYMMNYDMGFDQDEILAVQMKPLESYAATDAFAAKLKQSPMILDVAFAASDIVSNERMQWGRGHKDKVINFDCYAVSWNFLKFMGIDIVEGRDFTKDDEKRTGVFIFNEEAKRQYELEFDELFSGHQGTAPIVGFCKDFHFQPLQYGIGPFAFYLYGTNPWEYPSHAYIRVAAGTDYREAMNYIHKTSANSIPRSKRRRSRSKCSTKSWETPTKRKTPRQANHHLYPPFSDYLNYGGIRVGTVRDPIPSQRDRHPPGTRCLGAVDSRDVQPAILAHHAHLCSGGHSNQLLLRQSLADRIHCPNADVVVGICPGRGDHLPHCYRNRYGPQLEGRQRKPDQFHTTLIKRSERCEVPITQFANRTICKKNIPPTSRSGNKNNTNIIKPYYYADVKS